MGTSGDVYESLPARDRPSSFIFFENPKMLASFSCGLRPGNTGNTGKHTGGLRRVPQVQQYLLARNHSTWTPLYHTGGTYSHNGMMDYPRHPISELHLGQFLDSVDFQ